MDAPVRISTLALTHGLRDVAQLRSQEAGTMQLRMVTIQKDRHRTHDRTTGMLTLDEMGSDLMIASLCRISVLFTIYSLAWFLLAHVFAYTSTNTCRFASPHIWWLTFSILCLTYIAIAEVLLMIVFIFIVGPILLVSACILEYDPLLISSCVAYLQRNHVLPWPPPSTKPPIP